MSENLFKIFKAGAERFEDVRRLFTCRACGHPVMRGGKFDALARDSLTFCGCHCITIAFWHLETEHPTPRAWRKLLRLAKKGDAELIIFDPSKGGRCYGSN